MQRVAKEGAIVDPVVVDDAASRRDGRPSPALKFEPQIAAWLTEDPKLPTTHVLERLRGEGYDGAKTAVYDLVRRLRDASPNKQMARFEGLPGEFSQHDFGQVMVRYRDDSRERIKFFASVLKFSRMRRVKLVDDETTETVCHGLVDAFAYFESVPLIAVFDNGAGKSACLCARSSSTTTLATCSRIPRQILCVPTLLTQLGQRRCSLTATPTPRRRPRRSRRSAHARSRSRLRALHNSTGTRRSAPLQMFSMCSAAAPAARADRTAWRNVHAQRDVAMTARCADQ